MAEDAVLRAVRDLRDAAEKYDSMCVVIGTFPTKARGEVFKMRDEAFERLRTAIAAFEAASGGGWRPIESAPKDGTEIDIWDDVLKRRRPDCHWHCGKWLRWASNSIDDEPRWIPVPGATHWQPLPPPPKDPAT